MVSVVERKEEGKRGEVGVAPQREGSLRGEAGVTVQDLLPLPASSHRRCLPTSMSYAPLHCRMRAGSESIGAREEEDGQRRASEGAFAEVFEHRLLATTKYSVVLPVSKQHSRARWKRSKEGRNEVGFSFSRSTHPVAVLKS